MYGPLGDNWTDAADEPADGNEYVPRKTDADMEPMRVVERWDVELLKVLGVGAHGWCKRFVTYCTWLHA